MSSSSEPSHHHPHRTTNWSDLLKLATRDSPFTTEGFDSENSDWSAIKILVVGAGELGCELLRSLALSGFTKIHCIDPATVKKRTEKEDDYMPASRCFFREHDAGRYKAEVAAETMERRCPDKEITAYVGRVEDQTDKFFLQFQLVILACPNSFSTRNCVADRLAGLTDYELVELETGEANHSTSLVVQPVFSIPLIDLATTGQEGTCRLIQFGESACHQCVELSNSKGNSTFLTHPEQQLADDHRGDCWLGLGFLGRQLMQLAEQPRNFSHCILAAIAKIERSDPSYNHHLDLIALASEEKFEKFHSSVIQLAREIQWRLGIEDEGMAVKEVATKRMLWRILTHKRLEPISKGNVCTNAVLAGICVNEVLKLVLAFGPCTIGASSFYYRDRSFLGLQHTLSSKTVEGRGKYCEFCSPPKVIVDLKITPQQLVDDIFSQLKDFLLVQSLSDYRLRPSLVAGWSYDKSGNFDSSKQHSAQVVADLGIDGGGRIPLIRLGALASASTVSSPKNNTASVGEILRKNFSTGVGKERGVAISSFFEDRKYIRLEMSGGDLNSKVLRLFGELRNIDQIQKSWEDSEEC